MKILIATAKRPMSLDNFKSSCSIIRKSAEENGGKIIGGIIWTEGFGCSNLAFEFEGSDERAEFFANSLSVVLMPAKWSNTSDKIPEVDTCELKFKEEISTNEYEYKVEFLDEDGHLLEKQKATFTATNEDDAREQCSEWADKELDTIEDGFDHEITLNDVH